MKLNNKLFIKAPLDLRMKKTSSEIEFLNIEVPDLDEFVKNMEELDYENSLKDKLVKDTSENEIELTIKDDKVTNLIVYDLDNNTVEITDELKNKVIEEINSCLDDNPLKGLFDKKEPEINNVQTLNDSSDNTSENTSDDATFDFSDDNSEDNSDDENSENNN
jgi:hypothetical protein